MKGGRRLVEMKPQPEPERDVVDVEHAGLSPAGPALASARQRQINNRINRITEGCFAWGFLSGFARGSYQNVSRESFWYDWQDKNTHGLLCTAV